MVKEILAYSIEQAFAFLCRELASTETPVPKQFVDISKIDDPGHTTLKDLLPPLGIAVGWREVTPEENPNQTQTQVIDTVYPPGDKKWETQYVAVFDHPFSKEEVPGSRAKTKKEAVDITRLACQEQKRDAFVIMGKKPIDFVRCTAQILYKPSPKQKPGTYVFIY